MKLDGLVRDVRKFARKSEGHTPSQEDTRSREESGEKAKADIPSAGGCKDRSAGNVSAWSTAKLLGPYL